MPVIHLSVVVGNDNDDTPEEAEALRRTVEGVLKQGAVGRYGVMIVARIRDEEDTEEPCSCLQDCECCDCRIGEMCGCTCLCGNESEEES